MAVAEACGVGLGMVLVRKLDASVIDDGVCDLDDGFRGCEPEDYEGEEKDDGFA